MREVGQMNHITDLGGEWQLHPVTEFSTIWLNRNAPAQGWTVQNLPAHWQEEPVFKDYSGKMIFRKEFSIVPEQERLYRLEVGGVFYRYRVYLNNFALGGAKGYFYPTYYNITPYLKTENLLVLEVDSPEPTRDDQVLTGLFSGYIGFPDKYNPGGIWRPVRILSSGPAYFDDWRLSTIELYNDRCKLLLQTRIYASREAKAKIKLVLQPHNFEGPEFVSEFAVHLGPGINGFEESFEVTGVCPWWTWDLGDPNLYKVDLSLVESAEVWDQRRDLFGVRTFELKDFIPYLNGERIFIKGSSYLPAEIYPAKLNREVFCKDLALAKESNQNALRCYKHIEPVEFYQATDEAGILVWQDFPINLGYPGDAVTEVINQGTEMVKMLYNRASVVVWSLGNLSGYEDGSELAGGKRAYLALKGLSERVGKSLQELDPTRAVAPFSGRRGMPSGASTDLGFGCGVIDGEGDLFKFDQYRTGLFRKTIRFVSWFGAPSTSTHELTAFPLERTDAQRKEALGVTGETPVKKAQEAALASQEYQGEILRFYIDRLRYHKYNPTGGMFFFCLRSILPGAFWSVIDSVGNTKKSYYTVKLCYRPLYVFALLKKAVYRRGELLQFPICFSNDRHDERPPVGVKARLIDTSGQLVWKGQWSVTPVPDGKTVVLGNVSVMLMKSGEYTLEITWEDEESVENRYHIYVK